VEWEITGGVYDLLPNETLAKLVDANLRTVGGYSYSANENLFAEKIQKTFTTTVPTLSTTNTIGDFKVDSGSGFGSTDVGDVSWVVPTAGLSTATWVPGTAAHSWQAVAAGGTSIGYKGMMMAAKTLALSMMDVYSNPALIDNAWKEFRGRTGENFKYEALIGDRPPALDYRK
jgi:aminobenzoyl-glutamate utilization protein B